MQPGNKLFVALNIAKKVNPDRYNVHIDALFIIFTIYH